MSLGNCVEQRALGKNLSGLIIPGIVVVPLSYCANLSIDGIIVSSTLEMSWNVEAVSLENG